MCSQLLVQLDWGEWLGGDDAPGLFLCVYGRRGAGRWGEGEGRLAGGGIVSIARRPHTPQRGRQSCRVHKSPSQSHRLSPLPIDDAYDCDPASHLGFVAVINCLPPFHCARFRPRGRHFSEATLTALASPRVVPVDWDAVANANDKVNRSTLF